MVYYYTHVQTVDILVHIVPYMIQYTTQNVPIYYVLLIHIITTTYGDMHVL